MTSLNGKRILLIAAKFFGYENEIKNKLTLMGAQVDYFDQRPSNSFMTKALIRINKKFLSRSIDKYYADLIEKIRQKEYDYVLFISPEVITKDSFLRLKSVQPKADFILYMWDSVKNKGKNIHDIINHFDHRFSFDKNDCLNLEWNISYRPLFFLNDYAALRIDKPIHYDLLFIGTIHSDRYKILKQVRTYCEEKKLSYFYYMFFPSRILYHAKKLIDSSLRGTSSSDFRFHALGKGEVLSLFEESKVVIDVQHPQQTGLTMRTIEVLGARRKLITTNTDIINYDFYNESNILLVDRENIQIDITFFQTPMVEVAPDVYHKYSIDGWISDIFELGDNRSRPA